MNRKLTHQITCQPKPVSVKKQIKKTVPVSKTASSIVNKIRIKRIPVSKIKKAQKQNNNFLFSADAMQRSDSKLFMSLMYSKPEQNLRQIALDSVFNNQPCSSELKAFENTWNVKKIDNSVDSSKDNTLPYSQDEE